MVSSCCQSRSIDSSEFPAVKILFRAISKKCVFFFNGVNTNKRLLNWSMSLFVTH